MHWTQHEMNPVTLSPDQATFCCIWYGNSLCGSTVTTRWSKMIFSQTCSTRLLGGIFLSVLTSKLCVCVYAFAHICSLALFCGHSLDPQPLGDNLKKSLFINPTKKKKNYSIAERGQAGVNGGVSMGKEWAAVVNGRERPNLCLGHSCFSGKPMSQSVAKSHLSLLWRLKDKDSKNNYNYHNLLRDKQGKKCKWDIKNIKCGGGV